MTWRGWNSNDEDATINCRPPERVREEVGYIETHSVSKNKQFLETTKSLIH